MIAIVLGILKWIGIFVLATLGLTFFLILLILLVPVRYRLQGARSPQEGVLTASGKVSWLLSLLAVTFSYDREFSWKVKIFGIPLKLGQNSEESDSEELTEEQIAQIAELEVELDEESKLSSTAPFISQEQNVLKATEISSDDGEKISGKDPKKEPEQESDKLPLKDKIHSIVNKISETIHKILGKIAGIKEKIRSLKEQAEIWMAFIRSEEVTQLLTVCKKQIRQILRHLLPTRLKVRGNYGFEDPSLTGKITGVLCALPPRLQKDIRVQPHFQEECLDGEAVLQGRIRLGSLVWPAIKILVKPCTWKTYKKFKAITRPEKKVKNTKKDPHKGGKK